MYKRIKTIRKVLKMSQENFAKHIGLSQTSLSTIECGRSRLTDKNVKLICKTFNISENWLRTGNGEMLSASPHEKEFQEIFNQLLPDTQEYLLLVARELLKVQDKLASHFEAAHSENDVEVADDEGTK